ncbi:MAG: helix-turn-helix domain-containing protein [Chloroflexota bacterium]
MGHILSRHPRVVQNVLRLFAQRLRYLVSLVEDLSFRPVTARVAKLLLEQEEQREKHTQQEMAAQVGTVREVVGRSLKGLEALGAIKMVHGRVVIVNRRLLEELVESYP